MAAILLRLASGLVGWVVPWASPKLGYALAALFLTGLVWGHGYMKGSEGKAEAIAQRDTHWQQEIRRANQAHEQAIEDARHAAESEQPLSNDRSERMRSCAESPTCRDRS